MFSIFNTEDFTSKSYSEQTEKFPITSNQGNKYVFVLHHYDTNTIHMVPIKIQYTSHITQTWIETFDILGKNMVRHSPSIS